jgi:hypothetical protein
MIEKMGPLLRCKSPFVTGTDLRPVLDFHEPDPTTFRRLPDASSTSVVRQPSGGSHYWNSGYVQTGGQFKQLGEGAKEVRVL